MSLNKLLLIFCILFSFTAIFLFWKNESELDPSTKNFWNLSFSSLNSDTLDFTVTNYTEDTAFAYSIVEDKKVLEEGSFNVEKGTSQTVSPQQELHSGTVRVTHQDESKEIYRK